MTVSTSTALPVTRDQRAQWAKLLTLAKERDLWIQEGTTTDECFTQYTVESFSARLRPDILPHRVVVSRLMNRVYVGCTCPATGPCTHGALALWHADAFQFDLYMPLEPGDGPPTMVQCPQCQLWCMDAADLAEHQAADHTHHCKVCWTRCDDADALRRHYDERHNPNRAARAALVERGVALLTGAGRGRG